MASKRKTKAKPKKKIRVSTKKRKSVKPKKKVRVSARKMKSKKKTQGRKCPKCGVVSCDDGYCLYNGRCIPMNSIQESDTLMDDGSCGFTDMSGGVNPTP
jgi:hypothetical protein